MPLVNVVQTPMNIRHKDARQPDIASGSTLPVAVGDGTVSSRRRGRASFERMEDQIDRVARRDTPEQMAQFNEPGRHLPAEEIGLVEVG